MQQGRTQILMFCREKLNIYSVYCHIRRRKRMCMRPSTLLTDCWWMNLRPLLFQFKFNEIIWSGRRRRRHPPLAIGAKETPWCDFPSSTGDFIAKLALLANACVRFFAAVRAIGLCVKLSLDLFVWLHADSHVSHCRATSFWQLFVQAETACETCSAVMSPLCSTKRIRCCELNIWWHDLELW